MVAGVILRRGGGQDTGLGLHHQREDGVDPERLGHELGLINKDHMGVETSGCLEKLEGRRQGTQKGAALFVNYVLTRMMATSTYIGAMFGKVAWTLIYKS